jgi:hypothetical protein
VAISGASADAEVKLIVDGTEVPKSAQEFPRKVDPGQHKVEVVALGYETVTRDVTIAEREEKLVEIALVSTGEPVIPEPPPDTASGGGFEMPVWGWVGFGVGAAGFIVGGVTGGLSLAKSSDFDERCVDKVCGDAGDQNAPDEDEINSAVTVAHVSTAGFVVGGVGLAVGMTAVIVGLSSDSAPDETAAFVRPFVGPTGAGLYGRF